ncbi:MAG TPA: YggS family pyridoxal phosphate-dependent enzyme [Thiobacillaceae bacterium]|nr:YggS family pyridoxal phosphate-dependent enzyme [Thiobacillaceae bacterium]HNA82823.1 YggS family pyridoxal phosphate-dependent enzyme [Thiobacillaceae bacterium]HNH89597.1 YggS family pyridoxal phosphate-dependent enzyme [Thiobacillaceae bacterium]HNI07731.1 YggS family pyridoxal phosphate-dependent enzyme [Thiobacillaceae bacterium]
MGAIAAALQACRARIAAACAEAGRGADCAHLLAVSKTFPAAAVREAHAAGQVVFGESYVQEALAKMADLADLDLEWHFIGPLQSNKTRPVAERFSWVHSVDREKVARRLSEQRPTALPPLNLCIQVNVSGEASKSGVEPAQALALARLAASLPGIRLRGFMAIPEPTRDQDLRRRRFAVMADLLTAGRREGLALDTLSMGMSDDLEEAILEGATMVRVGTAIFGGRTYDQR